MLNVPISVTSGDRIVWHSDELSGTNLDTGAAINFTPDLYTLSFAFRGANFVDLTATVDGTRFKTVLDGSALSTGVCNWQAYIKDSSGHRTTVGNGQTVVLANLAITSTPALDAVQLAQQRLDRVNAALDAMLTGKPVAEYKINGRELKYFSIEALAALRETLKKELNQATRADLSKKGRYSSRQLIRFGRPS